MPNWLYRNLEEFLETVPPGPSFGPSVVDDTILSHDAALVWLTRQDRDAVSVAGSPPTYVVDTIVPSEAIGVALPMAATAVDAVTPLESVAGEFNQLLCVVSDSVTVTDSAERHGSFVIQVFDDDVVDERRFAATAKVRKVKIR